MNMLQFRIALANAKNDGVDGLYDLLFELRESASNASDLQSRALYSKQAAIVSAAIDELS